MYKNTTDNILTGVFSFIILLCLILIMRDVINYKKADREYTRIKEYITEDTDEEQIEEVQDEAVVAKRRTNAISDYEKLHGINNDLVCILSIPSLGLKYPVVQSKDNTKYLNLTFEGNKNPAGCLFMDYENTPNLTDPNTYIYGHNMKDGSMFGSLKKITGNDFDKSGTQAYLTTEDGIYSYSLERAEVVNIDEYKPPNYEEDMLTLYTCWGNDKSRRLLVTFEKDAKVA